MRSWQGCCAGALWLLSLPAAADSDLQFTRIETPAAVTRKTVSITPATVRRDTVSTTPMVRSALLAGDQLRTGPGGHVSVQLASGGTFTLADNTSVQISATSPPDPPGRSVLLQLRLERGAVHVDARKREQGLPADVRLALPRLQARLYGADAWAEASTAGDELCIVSGAAEADTATGHLRLDEPGECLRASMQGIERVAARDVGALAPRLAQTAFSDDGEARYAASQSALDGTARPSLAALATTADRPSAIAPTASNAATASAEPEPAPVSSSAKPEASDRGTRAWRLSLGASATYAQAQVRARQLGARGWNVDISETPPGSPLRYRLLTGPYATRAEAIAAQTKARGDADLRDCWILPTPR